MMGSAAGYRVRAPFDARRIKKLERRLNSSASETGTFPSLPQWQARANAIDSFVVGDGETKHWEAAMSFRVALDKSPKTFVTDLNNGSGAI
jgi:hypothetical protein